MGFKKTEHKNALLKMVREKRMILQRDAERFMNRERSLIRTAEALETEGKIKRQKVKVRMANGNLNDSWLLYMPTVKQAEILEYEKELINRPFSSPLKDNHCYKKREEVNIESLSETVNNVIDMEKYIIINNQETQIREYNGVRVVSAKDIATLHKKPVKAINQQFERNKTHFNNEEDYFIVEKSKVTGSDFDNLFTSNRQKAAYLFTETGYLMLVKTFMDNLSWIVQRELVNTYFKVKELKQDKALQTVSSINSLQNLDILEMMFKEMKNQNNRIDSLEQKLDRIANALS